MKKLLISILLVLALVTPVNAGPSSPLVISGGYPVGGEKQNPVEQQTDWPWLPASAQTDCYNNERCVINPLPCAWDVDDHWQVILVNRTLASGTTASGTYCQVMDADPQYRTVNGLTAWWSSNRARFGVHLTSPVSNLIITVTYVQQNKVFTLLPIPNPTGAGFSYEFCGHAVYDPGDSVLHAIPGSAGGPNNTEGIGIRSDITLSVQNPSRKAVRSITIDIQEVGAGAGGASCIINPTYDQQFHQYPFEWTQS